MRVNKKIRNVRVYTIQKNIIVKENVLTRLFMRIFNPEKKEKTESASGKWG